MACPKLLGSRQASCGLSVACPKPASSLLIYGLPKATLGILDRLQKPLGSRQASCGLSVACPKPASLFLRASEGNVRHFGPASKASRQPAGLLRPLCGLSETCLLFSYGLPKATLGILARLQTLPRASPQPCPLLGSWQACLFSSYGLPKATLGILARLQTLPRASPQPCPLLGRLPKATFSLQKLFGLLRPLCGLSEASRQPAGLLRPLCGLSEACLLSSYGLPKAT